MAYQQSEADRMLVAKHELRKWWDEISGEEADLAVSKAGEYGSYDLLLLGRIIADMTGFPVTQMVAEGQSEDEIHTELGIMFYVSGKLARWTGAIVEGRRVSDDTLADIVVYTRMVQRTRAVGGWPWGDGPNYSGGAPKVLVDPGEPLSGFEDVALVLEAVRRGLIDGAWVVRPDCTAEHTSTDNVRLTDRGHEHYVERTP